MAYQISSYGFTRWDGPPPRLVNQHLQIFAKSGQNGVSALALGIHGDPFSVNLEAKFPNQEIGLIAKNGYRFLVGAGPQLVVFNSVNYFTAFGHRFLIEAVEITQFKRHPLLIGPGFVYPGGWVLRSRWQMRGIT